MGRRKGRIKRGLWSPDEDARLLNHIRTYGLGSSSWSAIPAQAGIQRCGKSCRFRWMNYLRPGLKRGVAFSHQEQELILRLHRLLGNRWSEIAAHLPGRTDNAVKNFCNVVLRKQALSKLSSESQPKTLNPNLLKNGEKVVIACSPLVMNKRTVANPNSGSSNVDNVGHSDDNTKAKQPKLQAITNYNTIPSSFDHYIESFQPVSSQVTSYLDQQVIMNNSESGTLTCAAVKPDYELEDEIITSRGDPKSGDNQDNCADLTWVSDTQQLLLQLMAAYTNNNQSCSYNYSLYCSSNNDNNNSANDLLSTAAGTITSNGNNMQNAVGINDNVVTTDETLLCSPPNHELMRPADDLIMRAADDLICANDDMMMCAEPQFNCDYRYTQSY